MEIEYKLNDEFFNAKSVEELQEKLETVFGDEGLVENMEVDGDQVVVEFHEEVNDEEVYRGIPFTLRQMLHVIPFDDVYKYIVDTYGVGKDKREAYREEYELYRHTDPVECNAEPLGIESFQLEDLVPIDFCFRIPEWFGATMDQHGCSLLGELWCQFDCVEGEDIGVLLSRTVEYESELVYEDGYEDYERCTEILGTLLWERTWRSLYELRPYDEEDW